MSISKIWRAVRGSTAVSFLLLMLGPMFVRPLAFIKGGDQPRPLYAKIPGLRSVPLLVAGVYATSVQSFYSWIVWNEMKRPDSSERPADLFLYVHKTEWMYFWSAFVGVAFGVYVLSVLRWGYHSGVIGFIRKWHPDLVRPPVDYFIVTVSAWALWVGVLFKAMVYWLWHWDEDLELYDLLNAFVEKNPELVIFILVPCALLIMAANRNKELGMKALYGGSNRLYFWVGVFPVLAMVLLAVFVN